MRRAELRRWGPLLIVAAVVLYKKFAAEGQSVLGTRTMGAIKDFAEKLMPVAQAVERETGISAVLGVAEAGHESGHGLSALSKPDAKLVIQVDNQPATRLGPALNIFGFTAELGTYWRSQNRPFVSLPTLEYVPKEKILPTDRVVSGPNAKGLYKIFRERPFRAYASWDESYRDWARLMQTPRYVDAGALAGLKDANPMAFGTALDRAGYATDPDYGQKVVNAVLSLRKAIA